MRNWRTPSFILFEELAWNWLRSNLPRISRQRDVARLLHDYVEAGGVVDQQPETRELWRDLYPFHYDLRVSIGGRRIYFETCLEYTNPNDPDDPVIRVVNAHDT